MGNMALDLYEHNANAYMAAYEMMDKYGKAAIVHPTGTGKSYIAFKLIEAHPNEMIIWLSPSEYIFKTQRESLLRQDQDFPLQNVRFYTYAKLMCSTPEQLNQIAEQNPTYIILDEFHRIGAEFWGESTQRLLALCPRAKLLGLTATNVRYLDNNRDMAEELFNGHVASEMTLGEAIVRGILPAPKYVTTVYQYQKALAKYQARVDNLRTPGIQDVNQKYLDALRRALEQADGLDKVFADFKTDTGDRLKLLFCIDMLNEGVHVEGISGVILFRPTISPIIYKQQIARLDSIGMVWGNRNDRQWNQGYQEAKRYFEAHGDLRVPVNYVSPEGYALGKWVKRQRYTRQNPEKSCGALTEERMERLDAIGMIWNKMGS